MGDGKFNNHGECRKLRHELDEARNSSLISFGQQIFSELFNLVKDKIKHFIFMVILLPQNFHFHSECDKNFQQTEQIFIKNSFCVRKNFYLFLLFDFSTQRPRTNEKVACFL